MPATFECEHPGCGVRKTAETEAIALGLLQLHQANAHSSSQQKQRPPKMDRPRLSKGSTGEEWATFTRRWEMFKTGTMDMTAAEKNCQLIACCEQDLEVSLFQNDPNINEKTEQEVLSSMKKLAVVDVAATVRVTELLGMKQDHGEAVRAYLARVRGKAHICAFEKKCICGHNVDFSDEIVKWVVLAGLSSPDISREVFGTPDIDQKSLPETITIVETKERAARALTMETGIAATSTYKKEAKLPAQVEQKMSAKINCSECKKPTQQFGKNRFGKIVEYKMCTECFRATRSRRRTTKREPGNNVDILCDYGSFGAIGALYSVEHSQSRHAITNYVFDKSSGWKAGQSKDQPCITLEVELDKTAYTQLGRRVPKAQRAKIECVSDTGAQSCLMGLKMLWRLGLRESDLIPVQHKMHVANNENISLIGALFLKITGYSPGGSKHETSAMIYVSPATDKFYLSRTAMEQLKIIPTSFPEVDSTASINAHTHSGHPQAACGCPVREAPPETPKTLPFKANAENAEKMRQWLLHKYAASTFNVCTHQPLPAMSGPPMSIKTDHNATPVATNRPVRIPVHWREEVNKQLERDVALGVIEKVPPDTPVTWLHSMVITPKSDGTPRRTVDLQTLNKVSVRETHHTVPPAKQARAVPRGHLKTVMDAWNGYHSIPIKAEDRHKTTFLTENGRYRYCRAPMGFLASGDAYTHRYDLIVADVPRLTKCVDDALLHDSADNYDLHWIRVMNYLHKVGSNGIILNPNKFQFSQHEVNFTAFKITDTEVRPLPKYIDAIKQFPRPKNITDIRAWFGLVNQVSHYGKLTEMMAPFKPLLSPKTPFCWDDKLEKAFQNSKDAIVASIENGVEIFDPSLPTCLQTDYSGQGIGYWLSQKHCECNSEQTQCCGTGWKITLAGSRFLRDAEQRYAPIEGECLAIAWALEDTRWFTMGCERLTVVTDHKPLLKILGDRCLDDITNPRLFRLKQRTMMWHFKIVHVAGDKNLMADATSRHPATGNAAGTATPHGEDMEAELVSELRSDTARAGVATWATVQESTAQDPDAQHLLNLMQKGLPETKDAWPEQIREYWQYKERLSAIDGVIFMDNRMIIPHKLRPKILQALHAAHQGVSGMTSRAHDSVFWPGISLDISKVRNQCQTCSRIAPSQVKLPPVESTPTTYPFQGIAADYFCVKGVKYLVIVDRFSGWPHIVRAQNSSEGAGSQGLIRSLKLIFATFGAPEELSSDGGPEFTAAETQKFLQHWGVHHRVSAVYNPQSNGRAEVAVKSMKRLLEGCTSADGALNEDKVVSGLLQYRNTPDHSSRVSPAQILFGRPLRDSIPFPPGNTVFCNKHLLPAWRETWRAREDALRIRYGKQAEARRPHTRPLPPLDIQDTVQLQNLTGPNPKKWDRTGRVVEALPYDQYIVRVDGSGRVTRRNRRALKKYTAFRPLGEQSYQHYQATTPPQNLEVDPEPVLDPPTLDQSPELPGTPSPVTPSPTPRHAVMVTSPPTTLQEPLAPDAERESPIEPTQQDTSAPETTTLRRSSRIRRPPAYLKDYVTN